MAAHNRTLVGKDAPIKPGTIRRSVPAEYPEFSSDEEELPAVPKQGGNFRPHACDNEKPSTSQAASSQPSWADLNPELAAKSKIGGRVEDYKHDLTCQSLQG